MHSSRLVRGLRLGSPLPLLLGLAVGCSDSGPAGPQVGDAPTDAVSAVAVWLRGPGALPISDPRKPDVTLVVTSQGGERCDVSVTARATDGSDHRVARADPSRSACARPASWISKPARGTCTPRATRSSTTRPTTRSGPISAPSRGLTSRSGRGPCSCTRRPAPTRQVASSASSNRTCTSPTSAPARSPARATPTPTTSSRSLCSTGRRGRSPSRCRRPRAGFSSTRWDSLTRRSFRSRRSRHASRPGSAGTLHVRLRRRR
jgi:hypothetical protein